MTDDLPTQLTAIAYRPRRSPNLDAKLRWTLLEGSPLTIAEAHALKDQGLLIMVTDNNKPDVAILKVKKAAPYTPRVFRRYC